MMAANATAISEEQREEVPRHSNPEGKATIGTRTPRSDTGEWSKRHTTHATKPREAERHMTSNHTREKNDTTKAAPPYTRAQSAAM